MTFVLLPSGSHRPCNRTLIDEGRQQSHRNVPTLLTKRQRRIRLSISEPRSSPDSGQDAYLNNNSNSFKISSLLRDKVVPMECSYLKKLTIQDFVLVKNQVIDFDAGFNVVTGESGAGKSVLIEALSQILGKASLGNCIRSNCSQAVLEAVFHLSKTGAEQIQSLFHQFSVPTKVFDNINDEVGGDIVIRREIVRTESGLRSRCYVNSIPTSVRVLRSFSELFFDINGQHSFIQLGNKERQLALVDQIARVTRQKKEINKIYSRMLELKKKLDGTSEFEDEHVRTEAERLCELVENEQVIPGEELDLRYALQVLETHASSVETAGVVRSILMGEGTSQGITHAIHDVTSKIKSVVRQEQRNAEFSDAEDNDQCEEGISCALHELDDALIHLETAKDAIHKVAENIKEFASILSFDAVEQSELRQRLKKIERLLKEFDCRSSEELLELVTDTKEQLHLYYESDKMRTKWDEELASLEQKYIEQSVELSSKRREVAGLLRKAVEDCLYDLAMKNSRFDVRVNWECSNKNDFSTVYVTSEMALKAGESGDERYLASPDGLDSVEFLLAPGPAEPLRSLSAIASGGECARIMLAFKAVPTQMKNSFGDSSTEKGEDTPGSVLVLDELDTGVGSRLGQTVGTLLQKICTTEGSPKNQVICVSHLPQVAASATNHIKALKCLDQDKSLEIKFVALNNATDRTAEIKAMMGSVNDSTTEIVNEEFSG
eukprot:g9038.t1